jgi:5-dehydro-2-deoxygluconokinase
VTAKLQTSLHYFDLIVGTEEEFHIAGGSTDTIAALRAVRAVSKATGMSISRREWTPIGTGFGIG